MASLNRKDLNALFVLLAAIYFLDSVLGGFLIPWGIVVALLIVVLVLLSERAEAKQFQKSVGTKSNEIIMRIAVGVVLLGILLQNALVLAVGLLIGSILLYSPVDSLNINISDMSLKTAAASTKK